MIVKDDEFEDLMEVEQPLIFHQHYNEDQPKSKTTNVADLIHEINK